VLARMDMRVLVGDNVRRTRKLRGLTQEQFAEKSGFSQQYLSSLENGKRNPSVITVYEIAVALGVQPADLLQPAKKAKRGRRPSR
jgi:transcriptional regulator with XRE-family HTH domain